MAGWQGKVLVSAFFRLALPLSLRPHSPTVPLLPFTDKLTAAHSILKVVNTKIGTFFVYSYVPPSLPQYSLFALTY